FHSFTAERTRKEFTIWIA
ncbi:cysteine protease, YopT-type domain protein, partial [Escherichia coli 95.0183]